MPKLRAAQQHTSSVTATMRDRQSRGKDPYTKGHDLDDDDEDDEDEDDDVDLDDDENGSRMRIGNVLGAEMQKRLMLERESGGCSPKNESFEEREKRQFALAVLDSSEQLMMYAQSTNDSIPGQRYRFMLALCGFADEEEEEQRPRQQKQQQQQSARGVRRR
ncbi:hypothetical protein LLEC1_06622 [Akanthomyces lecanii]|uniref:Uncharacterized protein n=1 Tax=Cordyceps confragosa TaxID=2714763 RepID=A0A179I3K2_CORDF|nr:hypothetical protein LLEC1_06622 [Akanthomyces lecanii]